MDFKIGHEAWNVYHLADGTEVRVRVVLVGANRREGEFHPDGTPIYDLQMQQIVHLNAPEGLRVPHHEAPSQRQ